MGSASPDLAPVHALQLAAGEGWRVQDVLCRQGPGHVATDEQHDSMSVSCVVSGMFTYHSARASTLLTPGALLLGNRGRCYRCSHEHGAGDRCVSFQFEAQLSDEVTGRQAPHFRGTRVPPLAGTVALVTRAHELLAGCNPLQAEELTLDMAAAALRLDADLLPVATGRRARVAVAARARELAEDCAIRHSLAAMARRAGMSRYAFLRVFRQVTGTTPYQYLLARRLVLAAGRLRTQDATVTVIAADSGFGDLSEFTRRFRAHFGVTPGQYRRNQGMGSMRRMAPRVSSVAT
jgi:AraC-like DNA-binding protein